MASVKENIKKGIGRISSKSGGGFVVTSNFQ